jgi:predicted PurR-regulated permease PerM
LLHDYVMNKLTTVVALIVGVAALYLARAVLVPIALAMLLSFMVYPIVAQLTRLGLGRGPSVAVVVTMLFATLGAGFWILTIEFSSLSTEIPAYRDNLILKINQVRRMGRGGALEKAQSAVTEVAAELQKETGSPRTRQKPTPVVVTSGPTGLWQLPSVLEGLGGAAAVIFLVIFMLIEREDLRNRIIRLAGYSRLTTTTRALDEAGQRISRYLLMQSIINTSFGLGIAIGLLFLSVPYALLWGFLAAVLRFIPYVGVWLAALVLVVFALAAFPTWQTPLMVGGLFVVLELACGFVLEPFLYGQSAGVSQVALLCSVTFWAWLWGPVGLLLATPLTVCLVVLAKHVPGLEFVGVLMGDEPPITPAVAYYQRLLAGDRAEAVRVASAAAKDRPLEAVYDGVIVPALRLARNDRRQDLLPEEDQLAVWQATREIVDELAATYHAARAAAAADPTAAPVEEPPRPSRNVHVLAVPVGDEADLLGLVMLQHLLNPERWTFELTSPHLLAAEVLALVEETRPAVVCLGALPTGSRSTHTRYLCKRLRARFPDLRIIVGRWGLRLNVAPARRQLEAAGADSVGVTLVETREHLQRVHALEPPTLRPPEELEPALRT